MMSDLVTDHITIAEALQDEALLGAALGSPETWSTWLVALKAAFGIDLNRHERRAFAAIAGSRKPPTHKVQELWALCGRGSGKSRMAAAVACYVACFFTHDLDPGEIGFVLVLAGSKDQAGVVFHYALAFLRKSPIMRQMIESVTANEIRLTNNVVLGVHPNSYRSVRGRSLLCVVMDEVAIWRSLDDSSANPDTEVYRAVRPSLARMHGSVLIGISTPLRRTGLLYDKYKNHFDTDDEDVLVVKGPTTIFNPTIDPSKIAKELAADREGATSEWLAEFRSDLTALFDEQVIEDAIDYARPLELPPRGGVKYHAFTDASAGRNDAFTLCISHCEGNRGDEQWICDVIRGRSSPFDPRAVAEEYAALARQYHCDRIIGDAFAGEWVASAFRDAGVKYETSPLNKSALYLEALPHFNRGAASIPEHTKLIRELLTLERRVQRSGRDSVDHPKHGSDDYANALCGSLFVAMHELRRPKARIGAYNLASGDGHIHWKDEDSEATRVSFVMIDGKTGKTVKETLSVTERDPKWIRR